MHMAVDSSKAVNYARIVAILHIIVGFLLFCISATCISLSPPFFEVLTFPLLVGILMCLAGAFGIPGTRKSERKSRNVFAGVFMGMSIASVVMSPAVISLSSTVIVLLEMWRHEAIRKGRELKNEDVDEYYKLLKLASTSLVLGIVELAIGIVAVVCLCQILNLPCNGCSCVYSCIYLPYAVLRKMLCCQKDIYLFLIFVSFWLIVALLKFTGFILQE